jgi:hypothetical protein
MTVRVVHGVHEGKLSVSGRTVKFVAERLKHVFNISSAATGFLNGHSVASDTLLADGDNLEFVQRHGQKGGHPVHWAESEVAELIGRDGVRQMRNAGVNPVFGDNYESSAVASWMRKQLSFEASIAPDDMSKPVSANGLTVDPATNLATFEGHSIELSPKPFRLLYVLVKEYCPHRKHSFNELKLSVWEDDMTSHGVVSKAVGRLNKELSPLKCVAIGSKHRLVEMRFLQS